MDRTALPRLGRYATTAALVTVLLVAFTGTAAAIRDPTTVHRCDTTGVGNYECQKVNAATGCYTSWHDDDSDDDHDDGNATVSERICADTGGVRGNIDR